MIWEKQQRLVWVFASVSHVGDLKEAPDSLASAYSISAILAI